MEEELKELHHKLGLTFIYVTHNQEQALSLGDRVMLINKGIIEQIGSPLEIYMRPRNVFIARFLGEINLIRGKVIRKGEGEVEEKTSAGTFTGRSWDEGLQVNGEVTYAVRPEKVSLDAGVAGKANVIRGKFISLIYRGSEAECIAELDEGTRFKAILPGDRLRTVKLKHSDEITFQWDGGDAFVLTKVSAVSGVDIESLMYGR
jgi:ABC-type Fe3+/spermidine/putrescine transport system ATPase subunit